MSNTIIEKAKGLVEKLNVPKVSALRFHQFLYMGCDPEFFFTTNKKDVTGSEKLLPAEGLKVGTTSKIIIDGVQAEINPAPSTCRESLASAISNCFHSLNESLMRQGRSDIAISTDPLVDVSQTEMDSLSERSKIFGCDPSINIHEKGQSKIEADPKKYLKRSAGGHIHLGRYGTQTADPYYKPQIEGTAEALKNPEILVPMLDIIVGNTCVLLDRDPNNVERRRNYGKVGEFRIKEYGLEYRTLSNFWLRSYTTMSFVMGLARMAVQLVEQSTKDSDYVAAIFGAVEMKNIIQAIQENDKKLAMKNFKKIVPIIIQAAGATTGGYPIHKDNLTSFYYIVAKGLDFFIPNTPLKNWLDYHRQGRNAFTGWETFSERQRDAANRWKVERDARRAKRKAEQAAAEKLASVEVQAE